MNWLIVLPALAFLLLLVLFLLERKKQNRGLFKETFLQLLCFFF